MVRTISLHTRKLIEAHCHHRRLIAAARAAAATPHIAAEFTKMPPFDRKSPQNLPNNRNAERACKKHLKSQRKIERKLVAWYAPLWLPLLRPSGILLRTDGQAPLRVLTSCRTRPAREPASSGSSNAWGLEIAAKQFCRPLLVSPSCQPWSELVGGWWLTSFGVENGLYQLLYGLI